MSNNKLRVTVTFVLDVDVDQLNVRSQWSESDAKARFLALCKNNAKDGVHEIDFTQKFSDAPVPEQLVADVIYELKEEILRFDRQPFDQAQYCNGCDCELHEGNFDDEEDNYELMCNECLELQFGEEAALADKKHKEADKLD